MIAGVADTPTALWYLFGDARLSVRAKEFIDEAAAGRRSIEISPISLAEVIYLIEKNRLPASAFDDLRNALDNPNQIITSLEQLQQYAVAAAQKVPKRRGRKSMGAEERQQVSAKIKKYWASRRSRGPFKTPGPE
jgi:PIN domain nuclease of toxin-antitoxin system